MRTRCRVPFGPTMALLLVLANGARADVTDTTKVVHNPGFGIVVSATKTAKDPVEVPNATGVVSGQELRRHGVRTLAEAIEDVVGIDTGEGSDNGMRLPNIGMWGLKEFDALLITLDGVPVGGPFNPELEQIPVEDIDHIEFVKGPQGTLYGMSAFAGMIQVFSRTEEGQRGHVTVGGGSFNDRYADGAWQQTSGAWSLRLTGGLQRSDGWQDRTGSDIDHGGATLSGPLGRGRMSLSLASRRDTQRWGTPLPFDPDGGTLDPNFVRDQNVAVGGARLDHHIWQATSQISWPIETNHRVENLFGFTRDDQNSVRSFPAPDAISGDTLPNSGVALRPEQNTLYDDLRLVSRFDLGGRHESVLGGAVTWGHISAAGEGFDFESILGDPSSIPDVGSIPPGDLRSFRDDRTFLGAYAHDTWTPQGIPALTIAGGGRYDQAKESLHAQAQEQDGVSPPEIADDSRTDHAWSGDISALVRLVPKPVNHVDAVNAYVNWKSSFKPAAPNLTEAEGARILDPEHTHSIEVGLKTRAFDRQLAFDVAWFDLRFNNLVVPILGSDSLPALTNAGEERFQGIEVSLDAAPNAWRGVSVGLGYAHHDPKFVKFVFLNPDGDIEDDSGHFVELAPQELFNAKLAYRNPCGFGAFGALRWEGRRALDRDNVFFLDSSSEWDAGAWYEYRGWRASVTGRNLGDDRHIVAESDLADAMFYVAAPRRVTAELSFGF
jgi:outer membrane receptor protein involved in Fe transport